MLPLEWQWLSNSLRVLIPLPAKVRLGHPPKPLDTSAGEDAALSSLGIGRGEVLTVQEGEPIANIGITSPPQKIQPLPEQTHSTPSLPASHSEQTASSGRPFAQDFARADHVPKASLASQTSSNQVTAEQIRASLTKAQGVGSSSSRPAAPKPSVSGRSPGTEGTTLAAGPPARNVRPQQPPLPAFSGMSSSGAKPGLTSTEDAHVRVDGGWICLRVVPDDK